MLKFHMESVSWCILFNATNLSAMEWKNSVSLFRHNKPRNIQESGCYVYHGTTGTFWHNLCRDGLKLKHNFVCIQQCHSIQSNGSLTRP
uniref:Putative secreted protein ovary overexpressed n=1 Tax=Rhipicephalus microplus TaxID=6941 RepID=A0A6M2DAE2_RHIMP